MWNSVSGAQILLRDHLLDHVVDHHLAQLLVRDVLAVLRRDDHVAHRHRLAVLVLDGDLRLRVGTQERVLLRVLLADLRQVLDEMMRERDRQRHELGRLVAGEAEHQALVAGALVREVGLATRHALADVGRLAVDGGEHGAGVVVEAHLRRRVADLLDRLARDLVVGDLGVGRDLAGEHDHAGLAERLAGDAGLRVLAEDLVDDGVRDQIAHLVGVPLGDGLRGKEKVLERHRADFSLEGAAARQRPR